MSWLGDAYENKHSQAWAVAAATRVPRQLLLRVLYDNYHTYYPTLRRRNKQGFADQFFK